MSDDMSAEEKVELRMRCLKMAVRSARSLHDVVYYAGIFLEFALEQPAAPVEGEPEPEREAA